MKRSGEGVDWRAMGALGLTLLGFGAVMALLIWGGAMVNQTVGGAGL